ncbi:hypothetical protein Nepgr_031339 [Nepenthes gracilis]|uniref:Uncharacterized protein n=1 Tax=Nepenthes gracilis TaxID=150966 RepID=A0AAD3TIA1_NEPGR|nr:hypothetical protein Nepgr_031339 [Nepenthes gracilis]
MLPSESRRDFVPALSFADPDDGVVGSDSVTRAFASASIWGFLPVGMRMNYLLSRLPSLRFGCCCGSALRSWIEFLAPPYVVQSSSKVAAGMADLAVGVLLLLLLCGQWNDAEAVFSYSGLIAFAAAAVWIM